MISESKTIKTLSVEQIKFKLNQIHHKQWNKLKSVSIENNESSLSEVNWMLTSKTTSLLWEYLRRVDEYCRRAE